jgi:hypothetical protein
MPDAALQSILKEYPGVFTDKPPHGGSKLQAPYEVIPVTPGAKPVFRPMFRYSPVELAEMEAQVKELIELGFIQPSRSPYGAPVLFVKKPRSDKLRLVIDHRGLNKLTVRNSFPLPRIDDMLDSLSGAQVFSSIDLRQAYHQIQLLPSDVPKTAFRTPMGHYEFLTLSFGLVNAPAVFQNIMNDLFRPYLRKFVVVYLDDILVYSNTPEEHAKHLRLVLDVLKKHQLTVSAEKCSFNQRQVLFLGHIVSADGVKVDQTKVAAVQQFPQPTDVHQLRSFLGMANYFRRFIPKYSQVVSPLTDLLKDGAVVQRDWGADHTAAFDQVKQLLCTAPVLALPDWQSTEPFDMICDASYKGLSGVLLQKGQPVAYESRKLIPAERNYTPTEIEMLAVVHCCKKWRCYIEGRDVRVYTDHKPNISFDAVTTMPSKRQAKWIELLQSHRLQWHYTPGAKNIADPLSRHPVCVLAARTRSPAGKLLDTNSFVSKIKTGYAHDEWFSKPKNTAVLENRNGLYYFKHRLVIPEYMDCRETAIAECHDTPYSGHIGRHKTHHNVARFFWWHKMHAEVRRHVQTCDSCQRVKPSNKAPVGLLQPLPVAEGPWHSMSMDFVTGLPVRLLCCYCVCRQAYQDGAPGTMYQQHICCGGSWHICGQGLQASWVATPPGH